jgi:hypothetical protein
MPSIVSEDLWQAVQDKLKAHASGSSRCIKGQQPSLLAGLLFDSGGRAMTPSHASKGKAQRYRYYVTRPDQVLGNPAFRVSAHDLEQIVTEKLAGFFASPSNIAALASPEIEAHALRQALGKADLIAATLRSGTAKSRHEIVSAVLAKATLFEDRVELALSPDGLAGALECSIRAGRASLTLSVPATRLRRGHQIRLVIEGEGAVAKPEPLIRPKHVSKLALLLAQAYQARQLLLDSPDTPLTDLARQHGKCRKHLTKLIELSCLAPDIVEAIMKDQQPRWLTAQSFGQWTYPCLGPSSASSFSLARCNDRVL